MTIEEIKKILESYTLDKKYYNELIIDLEEMKSKYSKLSAKYGSVDLLNLELNRVAKLSEKTLQNIERVESTINSLAQPSKDILYFKYIKKVPNHNIAMRLNYSLPRIYQLINVAIKEFAVMYSKIDGELNNHQDYSKL